MARLKTFIAFDKEGNRLQGYMLEHYNFNEIKKYMTLEIYEKAEYIQELKWDNSTIKNEDGSYVEDMTKWKYDTNIRKHYFKKEMK